MSEQVLHIDLISLASHTSAAQRASVISAAGALNALDQVRTVGVIEGNEESDYDLVFFFLLNSFADLEPFGTDSRYSRFLQGSVAPVLSGFAGADVRLETDFAMVEGPAACLAVAARNETYDWEVREALELWTQTVHPRIVAVGVAVGERQRYRGAGMAFGGDVLRARRPRQGPFSGTLICGEARKLDT